MKRLKNADSDLFTIYFHEKVNSSTLKLQNFRFPALIIFLLFYSSDSFTFFFELIFFFISMRNCPPSNLRRHLKMHFSSIFNFDPHIITTIFAWDLSIKYFLDEKLDYVLDIGIKFFPFMTSLIRRTSSLKWRVFFFSNKGIIFSFKKVR